MKSIITNDPISHAKLFSSIDELTAGTISIQNALALKDKRTPPLLAYDPQTKTLYVNITALRGDDELIPFIHNSHVAVYRLSDLQVGGIYKK